MCPVTFAAATLLQHEAFYGLYCIPDLQKYRICWATFMAWSATCGQQEDSHLVSDAHKEAVYAVVLAINHQLSKYGRPFGMHRAIGDPVLLGHCGWSVDDELIGLFVKDSSCLHLHCVVAYSMTAAILKHVLNHIPVHLSLRCKLQQRRRKNVLQHPGVAAHPQHCLQVHPQHCIVFHARNAADHRVALFCLTLHMSANSC